MKHVSCFNREGYDKFIVHLNIVPLSKSYRYKIRERERELYLCATQLATNVLVRDFFKFKRELEEKVLIMALFAQVGQGGVKRRVRPQRGGKKQTKRNKRKKKRERDKGTNQAPRCGGHACRWDIQGGGKCRISETEEESRARYEDQKPLRTARRRRVGDQIDSEQRRRHTVEGPLFTFETASRRGRAT